jgi:hypothetical protein
MVAFVQDARTGAALRAFALPLSDPECAARIN